MLSWPSSILAPYNVSDSLPFATTEEQYQSGYMSDYSLDLKYSWQRELLNDSAWEDPYIAPRQAAP